MQEKSQLGNVKFKYLGTVGTNQNWIHLVRDRLDSRSDCWHTVQNLLSSRLLSRNLKIKIYKAVILPVSCMGVKLGSLMKRRLRVLGSIFGPKRDEVFGGWRRLRKRSFITCTPHQILLV
jgi:hypothetical protein